MTGKAPSGENTDSQLGDLAGGDPIAGTIGNFEAHQLRSDALRDAMRMLDSER